MGVVGLLLVLGEVHSLFGNRHHQRLGCAEGLELARQSVVHEELA